ncbi:MULTISPECIES: 2-amino-4-hydroxy-6-hydroxymethyldihydropteridine diphosphokinase [Uliginosibacterium]|uniref:2-amino-4-hydroxy-6-hydroxymethyldihydropteridine pyrophosphokinase n=1 Tax=Uliginosibacterium aquaticum TaxID=2731212 RepID=A0ABX2ISS8_9RHOO|nr:MULTISPECIES: 2-amino-4-hydroxy-6-hydroxymethyldihydropteridine diphosphokinase [Uliginosibacterium]MDO6388353.1 2-amino-4-hydroxy-6-hydroxymethyldihydropteridine diphosphokinase [Uliginosibacterium sp. 31-12]NSL57040.1 2-amino-4-hydroxy-6-hydroxymethyldihydropteridine diphosphokinase [Uliginosibacterium aquaticum]
MAVLAWIGLGANLGDPVNTLREAFTALGQLPGCRVLTSSSLYRTAPQGPGTEGQPDYVNAVAALDTTLAAPELLEALLELEKNFGRQRSTRNAARTLDLDLLLYGCEILDAPGLHLPHPRMHERAFVLIPLAELAPETRIPGRGPVLELLNALPDQRIARIAD